MAHFEQRRCALSSVSLANSDATASQPANSGAGGTAEPQEEDEGSSSSDEDSSSDDDSDSEYEVPVRSHGDWDAFLDEESGTEYYFNRKTNETSWDPPCTEMMPPHLAALDFLLKLMTNPYDLNQPHPLSSFGSWSLYVDAESMAMYYVSVRCSERQIRTAG